MSILDLSTLVDLIKVVKDYESSLDYEDKYERVLVDKCAELSLKLYSATLKLEIEANKKVYD